MRTARHPRELIDSVCAMHGRLSASQASRQCGLSRNAVISVWHRHLTADQRAANAAARSRDTGLVNKMRAKRAEPRPAPKPPAPVKAESAPKRAGPLPQPAPESVIKPGAVMGVVEAVVAIRIGQCRFPIGEGETFCFCAEPTEPGMSYCPDCARRVGARRPSAAQLALLARMRAGKAAKMRGARS